MHTILESFHSYYILCTKRVGRDAPWEEALAVLEAAGSLEKYLATLANH